MEKKQAVQELVDAHANLRDEEMATAIWIRQGDTPVWLVEVLPGFTDDDRAEEPTVMAAGKSFKFDLYLIAANEKSLRAAIQRDTALAKWIVEGQVVFNSEKGKELQGLAEQCLEAAAVRHV